MNRVTLLAVFAFSAIGCAREPMKIDFAEEHELVFHSPSASRKIELVVLDREGRPIEEPRLRWRSLDPEIASVSEDGFVTPLEQGETRVVARAGYAQREVPVIVRYYDKLRVTKRSVTVNTGELTQLEAEVLDADGEVVDGAEIAWSVTDPDVANVDNEGALIGIAPGDVSAVGRAGHLSTKVRVEVVEELDPAT